MPAFEKLTTEEFVKTYADKFAVVVVVNADFSATFKQNGATLMKVSKVGRTNKYEDLEGLPAQPYLLTQNDGVAKLVSGDWDNIKNSGLYRGENMANASPSSGLHSWRYVQVIKHDEFNSIQISTDFDGDSRTYRVFSAGSWKAWKEIFPNAQGSKPEKRITNNTQYTAVKEDASKYLVFDHPVELIINDGVFAKDDELEGDCEGGDVPVTAGTGVTLMHLETQRPIVLNNGPFGIRFKAANKATLMGALKPL